MSDTLAFILGALAIFVFLACVLGSLFLFSLIVEKFPVTLLGLTILLILLIGGLIGVENNHRGGNANTQTLLPIN